MDKAKKALLYAEKMLPTYNLPYNYMNGGADFAEAYFILGMQSKGEKVIKDMWKNCYQYIRYYLSLPQSRFNSSQRDCMYNLYVMQRLCEITARYNENLAEKLNGELSQLMAAYQGRGGSLGE